VSGDATATLSAPSLVGDGSGLSYVTYSWDCDQIWESDDDGVNDPWTLYADGDGLSGQYSEDLTSWIDDCGPTRFWHEFDDPGYYVLHVIVNAEIHDSRTGAVIETVSNDAYIGDGGGSSDASNARQAAGRAAGRAAGGAAQGHDDPTNDLGLIGVQIGSSIDWDIEFTEAIASKNYDLVNTMIEAMTDEDTAATVEQCMRESNLPDKMINVRQVPNRVRSEKSIGSWIDRIVEHAKKLYEDPNSQPASHWQVEFKTWFTQIGAKLKK